MTFPFAHLFFEDFFFEDFFFGTLPPSFRACDRPIAIACFLLVTFLPDLPLFSVPCFRSCIAFSTFSPAFAPYLRFTGHLSPLCSGDCGPFRSAAPCVPPADTERARGRSN